MKGSGLVHGLSYTLLCAFTSHPHIAMWLLEIKSCICAVSFTVSFISAKRKSEKSSPVIFPALLEHRRWNRCKVKVATNFTECRIEAKALFGIYQEATAGYVILDDSFNYKLCKDSENYHNLLQL